MKPENYYSPGNTLHRALEKVSESFFQVGCDMFQAIHEKAYELGGDEFAEEVTGTAFEGFDIIPNPDALQLLMTRDPNIGSAVMDRAKEIMEERQQAEIKARFPVQGRLRKFGKALIDANALIWTGQRPR